MQVNDQEIRQAVRQVRNRVQAREERNRLVTLGSRVVQRVRDLVLEPYVAEGFFTDERPRSVVLLRAQLCLGLYRCGFSLPMCALAVMQRRSHTTALGSVRRAGAMLDEDGLPAGFNERVRTVGELRVLIVRECEREGLKAIRGAEVGGGA